MCDPKENISEVFCHISALRAPREEKTIGFPGFEGPRLSKTTVLGESGPVWGCLGNVLGCVGSVWDFSDEPK